VYFFRLTAVLIAIFLGSFSIQSHAAEENTERPARAAQCFLEVNDIYYFGGDCLFAPLDKFGSFRITGESGVSAQVTAKPRTADYVDKQHLPGTKLQPWPGSKEVGSPSGAASWSGPQGGKATAVQLGEAINDERGCWVGYDPKDPIKETHVCAWDKGQRLYLGPTPVEPSSRLAWGERQGMYARIISSSGLNTEHASITAEKSREGAIIWCRVNHDYSTECIRHWLEDDTQFAHEKKMTLHANCKTKKYTDVIGRNLQALDDDILDLDTNDKISNSAGGTAVASSAFEALCPRAAAAAH
jgi:hypothetical protein